jgi:hypothetical protein
VQFIVSIATTYVLLLYDNQLITDNAYQCYIIISCITGNLDMHSDVQEITIRYMVLAHCPVHICFPVDACTVEVPYVKPDLNSPVYLLHTDSYMLNRHIYTHTHSQADVQITICAPSCLHSCLMQVVIARKEFIDRYWLSSSSKCDKFK